MNKMSCTSESIISSLKISHLQEMLTDFFGGASFIASPDGHLLTKPENLCTICNDRLEVDDEGVLACQFMRERLKNLRLGNMLDDAQNPHIYYCERTGLCEGLVPISVGGTVFGYLYLGQVRTEKTDENKLFKAAKESYLEKCGHKCALSVEPVRMKEVKFRKLVNLAHEMTNFSTENLFTGALFPVGNEQGEVNSPIADYYNSFAEYTPLGYHSLDISGNLRAVNRVWLDVLGYSEKDVVGRPFINFLADEDKKVFATNFPVFLEEGEVTKANYTMVHKNGSYVYVQFNGRIMTDINGNFVCTHCVMVDLSREQRAREVLSEAHARAIEVLENQSRFLSNISHELRTPLNSIIGFSEIMQKQIMGEIPPVYEEYINIIHTSGQHLLGIVNDLLDLSRMQANGLFFDPEPVEIKQQIKTVFQMMRPVLAENNTSLSVRGLEADKQVWMRGNATRFRQILINILSNSAKFAPGGHVDFNMSVQSGLLYLSIADDGPGMTEEQAKNALTPFGRNDLDPFVRSREGTGLGLPLAYQIVMAHGGQLEVETAPGKGTEIKIILPLHHAR